MTIHECINLPSWEEPFLFVHVTTMKLPNVAETTEYSNKRLNKESVFSNAFPYLLVGVLNVLILKKFPLYPWSSKIVLLERNAVYCVCMSIERCLAIPIFWWGGCSLSLSHRCHQSPSDLFAMLNMCWTQSLWSADMFYDDWPAGGTKQYVIWMVWICSVIPAYISALPKFLVFIKSLNEVSVKKKSKPLWSVENTWSQAFCMWTWVENLFEDIENGTKLWIFGN